MPVSRLLPGPIGLGADIGRDAAQRECPIKGYVGRVAEVHHGRDVVRHVFLGGVLETLRRLLLHDRQGFQYPDGFGLRVGLRPRRRGLE